MKKTFLFLLLLSTLGLLVACGGTEDSEEPTVAPRATPVDNQDPDKAPQPTVTPADYPSPPAAVATQLPEGYDMGNTLVWIIHPAGQQCVEELTYPDIQSAMNDLTEAGVTVLAGETLNMMVCEACDCPTSEHYRLQINQRDVETATGLGWTVEEGN